MSVAAIVTVLIAATTSLPSVAQTQAATQAPQQIQQSQTAANDPDGPPALADGLIIRYTASKSIGAETKSLAAKASLRRQQANALSAATGVTLEYAHDVSADSHLFWLPDIVPASEAEAIASTLMSKANALGIESIEPDYRLFPTFTPNDPRYADQWHYQTSTTTNYGMNLPAVWDVVTGSASLVIAVIDTGILFNHPDLAGRTVPGYDFISRVANANDGDARDANASDPGDWVTSAENASGPLKGCGASDSSWHGSHVAGTIGASSDNGVGVSGVNWRSKILPIRALGKCGGSLADIVAGMRWAAGIPVDGVPNNPNPARVLNLSLGGPSACSATYQAAVNEVVSRGVVVVVAAGNENTNASTSQPGNCNNVITVGSTRKNGTRAPYSNFGPEVDISAPGGSTSPSDEGGILSTIDSGDTSPVGPIYAYYQGTSMATPNVAGVISLMLSVQPLLQPAQVLQILQTSVNPFPAASDCSSKGCGTGVLDALKAVNAATAFQITRTFMPSLQVPEVANIVPGNPLTNGNFDSGRTAWTELSAYTGAHIIYSLAELQSESNTIVPHDGQYLAWLGGLDDETASVSQNVVVPAGATTLTFWYRIGSSDICGFDEGHIDFGDARIYSVDLCSDTITAAWVKKDINISTYAGKTLVLKFQVTTDESMQSSWYVDSITIQ